MPFFPPKAATPAVLELQQLPRWVIWTHEERDGKITKPPRQARDPKHGASHSEPRTWVPYPEAQAAAECMEWETGQAWGVGCVIAAPYVGVDLDHCLTEDGEPREWAARILARTDSYTEVSPSGRGLKVWMRGELPEGAPRGGTRKSGLGPDGGAAEMYGGLRYFTVTGMHFPGTPETIEPRQEAIDALWRELFRPPPKPPPGPPPPVDISLDDEELLRTAERSKAGPEIMALWRGDTSAYAGDESRADAALCRHLAFYTGNDPHRLDRLFRRSGLCRDKWRDREDYRANTIAFALSGMTEFYSPRAAAWPAGGNGNGRRPPEDMTAEGHAEEGVNLSDFRAYMPEHKFIFMPSGELWPATSVNARVPWVPTGERDEEGKPKYQAPAKWLDKHAPVEQMTWAPGEPRLIPDRLTAGGDWITRPGCTVFNLYRPPVILPGNAQDVCPWLKHLVTLYGKEIALHVVAWMAHRTQRPGEKLNHALVLGGDQGIGKDTLLEPLRLAVGPWNFADVSPVAFLARFNSYVKSVVLRVSEARDLGDIDRWSFYEHSKVYIAAPPDVLLCDEKNLREYPVRNVCGVLITTNYRTNGLYLPEDDRRHMVAWSETTRDDFTPEYWGGLWGWYGAGGLANVAEYLRTFDLSKFDPKAPPPRTDAWRTMVNSDRSSDDGELGDAIEALRRPAVLSKEDLLNNDLISLDLKDWLRDRKNGTAFSHRLQRAGYVPVESDQKDGRWKVAGRNVRLYGLRELTGRERLDAARKLSEGSR